MSPALERLVRALAIVALGMLGGFLLFRSKSGAAGGRGGFCTQCPAVRTCPVADVIPEQNTGEEQ